MAGGSRTCLIRGDGGRSVRGVLDRLGDRWTVLVIATLDEGSLRFTELQQRVAGVSQRMLTRTLRQLQRDGLVARTAFGGVPPRVEYALTGTGRTLIEPALALAAWAADHNDDVERSREAYDALIADPGQTSRREPGATTRSQR